MADRNISDLSAPMQIKCQKWCERMKAAGIEYLITCTRRTKEEQAALYAIGRTVQVNAPKVTWTLQSKHLTGDAFDFVIMYNGKPDWKMVQDEQWKKAVEIGKSLGLEQVIGRDGKVKEFAHLQFAGA